MPDLAGKKVIYFGFSGVIDPNGVTRLAAAFNAAVNDAADDIYLCMSSLGGYVGDGLFLYNHIRGLPAPITIHNTGSIASIATIIYVAASHRVCSAHAMFMMHPTTVGPFAEGVSWERLDGSLKTALADDQRTENILRERTSLTDDLLAAKRVREVQISPQEALEFGLAHEIAEFSIPRGHQIIQV